MINANTRVTALNMKLCVHFTDSPGRWFYGSPPPCTAAEAEARSRVTCQSTHSLGGSWGLNEGSQV